MQFLEAPEPTIPGSENPSINPYPGKQRLTFRADGTFKMIIFSDLHFGENPWDTWGPQQDFNSTRLMRAVLSSDKPDYVYVMARCGAPSGFTYTHRRRQRFEWRLDNWRKCVYIHIFLPYLNHSAIDTFKENSTTLIDEIVKPLNEARIPFSSTHGVSLVIHVG